MDVDEPLKRLANPDNIADKIEQNVAQPYNATVEQGNELFQDLGDQYAGRFISPAPDATDFEPTASGFTGAFQSGQGEVFDSIRAFIGSVYQGQLQAGFVEEGGLYALSGNLTIDSDGLSVYGLSLAQYFEATNSGETRRGYLGMNLPQGETVPAFSIIYTGPEGTNLVSNGDFETGDLTGWTDTDSAWQVDSTAPNGGTYSAFHDGTLGIFGGDLVQGSLTAAAGDIVTVAFSHKRSNGILAGRMKVDFYDSTSGLVDTEYIYGAMGNSWTQFSQSFLAPATTASVTVSWEVADPFNDEHLDDVSVYVTDTLKELRFTDAGIKIYDNGVESSIVPEYPQNATMFLVTDMITSVTTAVTRDANQNFGNYVGPTAVNANDLDEYTFSFNIQSGTYTIELVGFSNSTSGKTDVYIDDVLVGSGLDWYSAAGTNNVSKTVLSVSITAGQHVLKVKVNGKNASSTDFRWLATYITVKPSSYS